MRNSPLSIAQFDGLRLALWGWGREGRAAYRAIRRRLPMLPLTLFCGASEVDEAHALEDVLLRVDIDASAVNLSLYDVVVKSPGISPYKPEAVEARQRGTRFIGGTALWFAEHAQARTICVTGTKGKSTTTALLAHLLRAGGYRTALCGNIGMPLLELLDPELPPEFWVIELSSYQTRDVGLSGASPMIAVATNIFPEHLDWHGSEARYIEDKLSLFTEAKPHIAILNHSDLTLAALSLPDSEVRFFGDAGGWHLRGDVVYRGERAIFDSRDVPLPGRHNRSNLCAVLAAIEALGLDAEALAPHAVTFQPLPHRLQTLGSRDGIVYVNDSISTTPHASLAALDCFRSQRVALIVGGHDRGIGWSDFADIMRTRAPVAIVTLGQNGPKIHDLLEPIAGASGFTLDSASDLGEAVARARALLGGQGVVLLSPGAPSFGAYRDYTERGRHFAALAGFDPEAIASIQGIGLAGC